MLSLTGGDMILPDSAGTFRQAEPIQTVCIQGLRVALKYHPGAAAAEHYLAVFRIVRIQVCRQQSIIATGKISPGDRAVQHCPAAVGSQKVKIFMQQFGMT